MKALRTALWLAFMVLGPLALVLLLGGFSKPMMKQHYSMNWIEMEDPFTGEMEIRNVRLPTRRYVDLCSTVGCQTRTMVLLAGEELAHAKLIMAAAKDPPSERRAIAKAIAFLELYTCGRTGTCKDRPDVTMSRIGQLDCVDEATNTSSYIGWMQLNQMLRWHDLLPPQTRGFPVAHWFAVISSKDAGQCVVESDFNKTGQEPVITCRKG